MQLKTSSTEFKKYGSVYEEPIDSKAGEMISTVLHSEARQDVSSMYIFESEVFLEPEEGMAALIVSNSKDPATFESFMVHRLVRILPGTYFALVAITPEVTCKLITDSKYSYKMEEISPAYAFERILPTISVREILGHYYSIRNPGYEFKGETHNYYELTYVDRGCLITEIDGTTYTLKENDLILYGPGQFHTQRIESTGSCSYVTVVFDMTMDDDGLILNKIFSYEKKIHKLIKAFVSESNSHIPYMDNLMLCLLNEIVTRLMQQSFVKKISERPSTNARQHYQDELLERILSFVDEAVYEPLTIAEICHKFSISRSTLQILFRENLGQAPKKYINELKLEKSRQMICENRYTISEIALMLGFNSIHYFSRAFAQKFNMAPSEYAKMLYKK